LNKGTKEILLINVKNPFKRYFFATRPAFLTATLAACLLGFASASFNGPGIKPFNLLLTVLIAVVLHAAFNVLNDYYDAISGTDANNVDRIYPFTGGSRFIQNKILTLKQTAVLGYGLLATAILGGLWLVLNTGLGLLMIGIFGVFLGWAYSAPPLKLNSHGWGELAVFFGFLGVTIGADFVQRQAFHYSPIWVGVPYALLVTNLLYINQFPDLKADAAVGKRHWVARLSTTRAVLVYPALILIAGIWQLSMALLGRLPFISVIALLPMLLSLRAAGLLRRYAQQPTQLRSAIQLTIVAMLSHAMLLSASLFFG
jgi:1,4-dihydroxy-2-naphthoate polyprenyltransferase